MGPESLQWHGTRAGTPDWSEESRLVAFSLSSPSGGLYIAFNSGHLAANVELPHWHGRQWRPLLDSSKVNVCQMEVSIEEEYVTAIYMCCKATL